MITFKQYLAEASKYKDDVPPGFNSSRPGDHKYSVKILQKGKGKWPTLKGEIYEKDVLIGTFSRAAVHDGYIPPIVSKFRTTAAKARFEDFSDSNSIEETIEALLPRMNEAKKPKAAPVDDSPEAQLKRLPQPIGINGGSYTYWADVTKTPLKFIASDGSEINEAKTLRDIEKWLDRYAAKEWLSFLDGDGEDVQWLIENGVIRLKKGRTDQQDHESKMRG